MPPLSAAQQLASLQAADYKQQMDRQAELIRKRLEAMGVEDPDNYISKPAIRKAAIDLVSEQLKMRDDEIRQLKVQLRVETDALCEALEVLQETAYRDDIREE